MVPMTGRKCRPHVGVKDRGGPPSAFAFIISPERGDDLVEVLAEIGDGFSFFNGG